MTTQLPRRRKQIQQIQASAKANTVLAKEGLDLEPRPREDQIEMDGDLSDLEDKNLIALMYNMTAWADFAAGQLAVAEIDLEEAESILKQMREQHLVRTWEDDNDDPEAKSRRKGVTVRKAELAAGDDYKQMESNRITAFARRRLLIARMESFIRREALASRELTRRTTRDAPQRRTARLGN